MSTAIDKLEEYLREMEQVDSSDTRLLRQIAYDRLQEAIKNSDLQSGEPLSETRISKALGISRTPVREAIHVLESLGAKIIPIR